MLDACDRTERSAAVAARAPFERTVDEPRVMRSQAVESAPRRRRRFSTHRAALR
jgi:hypothetical protein